MKIKLIIISTLFLVVPLIINAQNIGQEVNFKTDSSYDLQGRQELKAILIKITNQLYFYVDVNWWNKLDTSKKIEIDNKLYGLANEFEYKIYPTLTSNFGTEPKPGIDNDEKITILLHPMITEAGGYTNSCDLYEKLQCSKSNQKEMIYLNSQHIDKPQARGFLAHEFTHLITASQKDLLRNVAEETWLNEARAEYSTTFLGYDNIYKGSNLERRVNDFLRDPKVSLTEWLNRKEDYGAVNLFTQYLVDHYGVKILADSLQSDKTGIRSLDGALTINGFKENFSQIFTDWLITVLINNCNISPKYCYKNEHLRNLRITPQINFLPYGTESTLSVFNETKEWAGNWLRLIGGGKGTLVFEFDGQDGLDFKISYLICDYQEKCQIYFLNLDKEQKGKIILSEFNIKYTSLTIIISAQTKTSGFGGREPSHSFFWRVAASEKTEEEDVKLKEQLLARIAELQAQVRQLEAKLAVLKGQNQPITCQRFDNDLYLGIRDSAEVSCLQEFLKAQGLEIYPEGLITGNFLSLTQAAVIRFQEKYAKEILIPLGLGRGTGYVSTATRAKINQLLE